MSWETGRPQVGLASSYAHFGTARRVPQVLAPGRSPEETS
jgi:hypothetical protein